jgi:(p)ppGpp synthase/HD superfamily hydrolase
LEDVPIVTLSAKLRQVRPRSAKAASPVSEREVERAIAFLVQTLRHCTEKKGKPVVLHSLRVGLLLQALGYPRDVVLAGYLHDVLENSDITAGRIKRLFGDRVATLVKANTRNERITERRQRYVDLVRRCAKAGPEGLAVRAADLVDNLQCQGKRADFNERRWVRFKTTLIATAMETMMPRDVLLADLKRSAARVTMPSVTGGKPGRAKAPARSAKTSSR